MDTIRRGGVTVDPFGVGGFALGWSRDDISAQQKTVTNMMQNISVAIDVHKVQLPVDKKDAWYALAQQCLHFVSADVPLVFGVDDMAAQGASLVKQLNQSPTNHDDILRYVSGITWHDRCREAGSRGTFDITR